MPVTVTVESPDNEKSTVTLDGRPPVTVAAGKDHAFELDSPANHTLVIVSESLPMKHDPNAPKQASAAQTSHAAKK